MAEQEPIVLVYVPCPDLDTATSLGKRLVEERHAACVNIFPEMISCYHWQGRVEDDLESVLIVKTRREKLATVRAFLDEHHPYEVPAILTIPLEDVNAPYREWLLAETG
jgi:periplasmic divalent cation tolerance protein